MDFLSFLLFFNPFRNQPDRKILDDVVREDGIANTIKTGAFQELPPGEYSNGGAATIAGVALIDDNGNPRVFKKFSSPRCLVEGDTLTVTF